MNKKMVSIDALIAYLEHMRDIEERAACVIAGCSPPEKSYDAAGMLTDEALKLPVNREAQSAIQRVIFAAKAERTCGIMTKHHKEKRKLHEP